MTGNVQESEFLGLLEGLSSQEMAFVMARSQVNSDAKAYRSAKIPKGSFYTWPTERREYLGELADKVRLNRWLSVEMKLRAAYEPVMDELIRMARSQKDSAQKFKAMERILDEIRGRPSQRVQVGGGMEDIVIRIVREDG